MALSRLKRWVRIPHDPPNKGSSMPLTPAQEKAEKDVVQSFSGGCSPSFDPDSYGLESEDDIYDILIENEIECCATCGWWQYSGDYCHEHEHEEICCHDCCEEKD
jgi:hypothetical protein